MVYLAIYCNREHVGYSFDRDLYRYYGPRDRDNSCHVFLSGYRIIPEQR